MVPTNVALEGLLHEGEEPYTNDLNTCLKYAEGMEPYRHYGENIRRVVWQRFGLVDTPEIHAVIKQSDLEICDLEKRCLFLKSTCQVIEPWPADKAKQEFLRRFNELFLLRHQ